ncbi:hypothetical protein PGS49_03415 [Yersinia intermedia]|uniref:hypothetical protein n=1 Tax=Yersinia intermedia TaxID=631 RepID=UPI0022FE9F26|nr:hypothetical protein [Yersinia intermedia]MDA5479710.1 hypothetical protein [Yersinia intermedia]
MNKMTAEYLFLTLDPSNIRHATTRLERLNQTAPVLGSQQAAEKENQQRIVLLQKTGKLRPVSLALAKRLKGCRNESPCGSVICSHCQRERNLALLKTWLPLMTAQPGYTAIMLVFNQRGPMLRSWNNMLQASRQISSAKQRISRTLKRLGCSEPAIGTFSLLHHTFSSGEHEAFWLPQLCLLLPNNQALLQGLKKHMERGEGQYISTSVINSPMSKIMLKDPIKLFKCVFDPIWHQVACTVSDEGDRLIKNTPVPLTDKVLAKSLLLLDELGVAATTFNYCGQAK